jgi:hypothetical protein
MNWDRTNDAFNTDLAAGSGDAAGTLDALSDELFKGVRTANKTSPIKKRKRRTQADMDDLREAIIGVLEEDQPMTVRQVFYRLVSFGAIEKSENEYKNTVCRLLTDMRLDGSIPFYWIADNTRWQRKPVTYNSLEQMLRSGAQAYRRALWQNQDTYVEVWLEKDALSGVLYDVTGPWDVPLMVTRGYPSISYLYDAAEQIQAMGKPAYLYYFGDRDPSGLDIERNVGDRLREFAPDGEIHLERVAVTPEQIEEWGLLTRPTKKSDSRSGSFSGESVEVDAIPPKVLRHLVEDRILQHVDHRALNVVRAAERDEREILLRIAGRAA